MLQITVSCYLQPSYMDIIYQNSSIFKEMAVLAHFGIIFKDVVPKYPFDAAVEFKATNQIILQIAMPIYIYIVFPDPQ